MGFTVRSRRTQHRKLPQALSGAPRVKVGFPSGKTDRGVVQRMVWNHFGTRRGIPSRPFLLNAMRKNSRKYRSEMKKAAKKILLGEITIKSVVTKLGVLGQGDVQDEMTNLRTPPNAASTIRQKGSSNPLIETGESRGAVTYEVVK